MEASALPILIVDDDPVTTHLLRGLLQGLQHEFASITTAVATGAAARVEFRRGVHELVLLDYQLPDEDGLSLLAAVNLLPANKRPLVIMLTGAGSEEVAVEAMKLGARDYLVKTGVNLPALRRAILGALERRRLEARLRESAEQLQRNHVQLEADLNMAREVQQALLPQQYPVFPAGADGGSRLRFCHRWIPSHNVAGDFFTVFPVGSGKAGVFLCDVMGHGVRAALITALVRGLLREQQALAGDPGAFLGELNRQLQAMLARVNDMIFVTAVYFMADASSGEVRLANAGHPAPLHLQRTAGTAVAVTIPGGPGPALGMIPEATYEMVTVPLAAGDGMLVFTDGVYEIENEAGEEFGRNRLRESVAGRLGSPTARMLDGLLAQVKAFRPPLDQPGLPDDVCLVAMDFSPGD